MGQRPSHESSSRPSSREKREGAMRHHKEHRLHDTPSEPSSASPSKRSGRSPDSRKSSNTRIRGGLDKSGWNYSSKGRTSYLVVTMPGYKLPTNRERSRDKGKKAAV